MFRFIVLLTSLQRNNERMKKKNGGKNCSNKQSTISFISLWIAKYSSKYFTEQICSQIVKRERRKKGRINLAVAIEMVLKEEKNQWTIFCSFVKKITIFSYSVFRYWGNWCEIDFSIISKENASAESIFIKITWKSLLRNFT